MEEHSSGDKSLNFTYLSYSPYDSSVLQKKYFPIVFKVTIHNTRFNQHCLRESEKSMNLSIISFISCRK